MLYGYVQDALLRLEKQKHQQHQDDDVIPLRELAQLFDYSQDYLRNLINRGNLKAQKRGKLWYVRVGDMHHYLKER